MAPGRANSSTIAVASGGSEAKSDVLLLVPDGGALEFRLRLGLQRDVARHSLASWFRMAFLATAQSVACVDPDTAWPARRSSSRFHALATSVGSSVGSVSKLARMSWTS